MSDLDFILGGLDDEDEPGLLVSIDIETIKRGRKQLADLRTALKEARETIRPFAEIGKDAKTRGLGDLRGVFLYFTREDDGKYIRFRDMFAASDWLDKWGNL